MFFLLCVASAVMPLELPRGELPYTDPPPSTDLVCLAAKLVAAEMVAMRGEGQRPREAPPVPLGFERPTPIQHHHHSAAVDEATLVHAAVRLEMRLADLARCEAAAESADRIAAIQKDHLTSLCVAEPLRQRREAESQADAVVAINVRRCVNQCRSAGKVAADNARRKAADDKAAAAALALLKARFGRYS